jgi:DNA-binding NarL/FixJ family response regulator
MIGSTRAKVLLLVSYNYRERRRKDLAMGHPQIPSIRMLLVDDHTLVREMLRVAITQRHDMLVVGEAESGAEAVRLAKQEQPDIIVLDLKLKDGNALQIIPTLRAVASNCSILVMTGLEDTQLHLQAACLGAIGLVQKNQSLVSLMSAIEQVSRGEAYLDPKLVAQVLGARAVGEDGAAPDPQAARIALLTERERAVCRLVGESLLNKEIGLRLSISETTVRHHLTSIFTKLGLTNRVALALYAWQHGLAGDQLPAQD